MKYRVGQRVRVVSKRPTITKLNWHSTMDRWLGQIVTISGINSSQYDGLPAYYLEEAGYDWTWTENWLLPISGIQIDDTIQVIKGPYTGVIAKVYAYGDVGVMVDIDKQAVEFQEDDLVLVSRKHLI